MKIQISDSFTYGKLLRFTFPSIIMMVFTSIYVVVDGFFVSNFVGKSQFTAVNFIMPFLMILGAIGFMFGTGGSAIVAKTMGENKPEKAKEQFSLFVYTSAVCGIIISVLGIILIRPTAVLLGADSEILEHCVVYGRVILIALPFYILQYEFQSFFIAAGKPQLGLTTTVVSGVTNMVLDFLLIKVFSLGLVGAAAATAMSQFIGGVIPLIYFGRENSSTLRLKRTKFSKRTILNACINGSSELMSNISMSLLGMLYNRQLIRYAGNDGVAAYGVLMYVNFAFLSAFIGYSVGTAPVISYHYGAGNSGEIKSILGKSYRIIAVFAIIMFSAALLLKFSSAMMQICSRSQRGDSLSTRSHSCSREFRFSARDSSPRLITVLYPRSSRFCEHLCFRRLSCSHFRSCSILTEYGHLSFSRRYSRRYLR